MTGQPTSAVTLIVDDEPFIRSLVVRILKKFGVTNIVEAGDGVTALKILDEQGPNIRLILSDVNMPGMDGVEFLRILAERDFKGYVALISGEDTRILDLAETIARSNDLKMLGTLSKPVTEKNLAAILARVAA